MKPIFLESLFLVFGIAGCLGLMSGCLLIAIYLSGSRQPRTKAVALVADDDVYGQTGFRPGWSANLLLFLLGGSVLIVASFWWIGLVVTHLRPPVVRLPGATIFPDVRPANLFPWD